MLKAIFPLLLLLLLLPQLEAFPLSSHNSSDHGVLQKRFEQFCSGLTAQAMEGAFSEVNTMVQGSIDATNSVQSILSANPVNVLGASAITQAQFRTFETIFGQIYFGPLQTTNNALGMQRVRSVQQLFSNLATNLRNIASLDVQIFCDDSWVSPTDTMGNRNPQPLVYWDSRPSRPNPDVNGWIDFTNNGGSCRDNTNTYGVVFRSVWGAPTDVVTMCQGPLLGSLRLFLDKQTISSLCSAQIPTGTFLGDVVDSSLARKFLHELTHSSLLAGGLSQASEDQPCPSGGKAYGWACIVALARSNPTQAVSNADSLSYFAAAMSCGGQNEWSTGLARPLIPQ